MMIAIAFVICTIATIQAYILRRRENLRFGFWDVVLLYWITLSLFPLNLLGIIGALTVNAFASPELSRYQNWFDACALTQYIVGFWLFKKRIGVPSTAMIDRLRWVPKATLTCFALSWIGSAAFGGLFHASTPIHTETDESGEWRVSVIPFSWLDTYYNFYASQKRTHWLFAQPIGGMGEHQQKPETYLRNGWEHRRFSWSADGRYVSLWDDGKVIWAYDRKGDINSPHGRNAYEWEWYRLTPPRDIGKPGSVEFYRALTNQGLSLDTFLQSAIEANDLAAVNGLLDAGAKINGVGGRSEFKLSPLSSAILDNRKEIADFLLSKGADPNAHFEMLEPLTKGNVTYSSTGTVVHTTAIYQAARWGRDEMITLLLQHGGDPNRQNGDSSTPLMAAAKSGYPATVKYLLKLGAKKEIKDISGSNAVDYARKNNHPDIVSILTNPQGRY